MTKRRWRMTGLCAVMAVGIAAAAVTAHASEEDARLAALQALSDRLAAEREEVYVYSDFGMTKNHFTQKAKMAGINADLVMDMDENWREYPASGSSCIRCEQLTREGDWGGWLFLNGYLPLGESTAHLNDGTIDGQGLNLGGAQELRFMARGEHGGETVEFFTAGFGYDGEFNIATVKYPDSAKKHSTGEIELTDAWQEYVIDLTDADMSDIALGFGFVTNDAMNGNSNVVFYLDEIRFTGQISSTLEAPVLLRSYDTDNIYIRNAAFTYDNALAAMAFLSEGRSDEARQILDALVYAAENDRAILLSGKEPEGSARRIRNGYAAGDISSWPGWESGARLPGWYDNDDRQWYEDRYQVGSNVGNTSYATLALIHGYDAFGSESYLETAKSLMDWVLENCTDGGDGFTGGFDGWEEGDPPTVYPFTYKSIEHNIDAYAAFTFLNEITGEEKYGEAAQSALRFIDSMYDKERGLFMTGTTDDGKTPNRDVVVLDAQVWCAMALGEQFAPYEEALKAAESMRSPEGAYPFCLENRNGGWWAEGTAYTALMYKELGDDEAYARAMEALMSVQLPGGLFPAATVDNLSTGMDLFDGSPWEYSKDPHIAPTAWYILAANGFDPYHRGV